MATIAALNTKINELTGKIPGITNLASTTALTAVENKIPDISNLVKRTDYNTKISEIEKKLIDHDHDEYITTPEFDKLTAEDFAARLAQANSATKNNIASSVKKTNFDDKLKYLNQNIPQINQKLY